MCYMVSRSRVSNMSPAAVLWVTFCNKTLCNKRCTESKHYYGPLSRQGVVVLLTLLRVKNIYVYIILTEFSLLMAHQHVYTSITIDNIILRM